MHDLVRVTTEQELARLLERFEHQCQLHWREILHLVDHDEVVARLRASQPVLRDQIQVE